MRDEVRVLKNLGGFWEDEEDEVNRSRKREGDCGVLVD